MTYRFSERSMRRLEGVHPALVATTKKALSYQVMDFSVIEGLRTIEMQEEYFKAGTTRTMNSKHLEQSDGYGWAVDLYPHPIDMRRVSKGNWPEIIRFGVLAGIMYRAAQEVGCTIRWGMDWDMDGQTLDHTFHDAPHFELVAPPE